MVWSEATLGAHPGLGGQLQRDVSDSQWLADLLAHGMRRRSLVPERGIEELRELTRSFSRASVGTVAHETAAGGADCRPEGRGGQWIGDMMRRAEMRRRMTCERRRGTGGAVLAGSLAALLIAAAPSCSRHIEEEPPIPEHRLEPCQTRCEMLFDPACPARELEVATEEECFESCIAEEGIWVPIDGHDQCAATEIAYIECVAALPCDEIRRHYALINERPIVDLPCAETLVAKAECQLAHDS